MEIKHIHAAIDAYRCVPGASATDNVGIPEDEIAELEGLIQGGYKLPAAYKEYLYHGGNGWGDIQGDNSMYFATAWRMAADPADSWPGKFQPDEEDPRFPDNIFLIDEGPGNYFRFVKLDEGDDPPVNIWMDDFDILRLEDATMDAPSFSVFLHSIVAKTRGYALGRMQTDLARKTDTLGWSTRTPPIDIPKPEPDIQAALDTFQAIPGIMLEPRVGCTEAEIDALEAHVTGGRKLPFAYRQFLAYAGHQWGSLPLSKALNYGQAIAHAQDPAHHWIKPHLDWVVTISKFPFHGLVIGVGEGFFILLDYTMCDEPRVSVVKLNNEKITPKIDRYHNFSAYLHHMAGMEKLAYDRQHRQEG